MRKASWVRIPLAVGCLLAIVLMAEPARAQVVTASITGTVEDPSGAAIAGASVTVTDLETGVARTAPTDEAGNYRVLSLPVGRYEVKAEKPGFKVALQTGITLVVGQQAAVNLKLEIGAVQQEVTMTAEAPVVNTSTASVAGLVGEQAVKDLPLNGRSFDLLITLNAGAINYTAHSSGASGVGLAGAGNNFSVAGRRVEENLFLLNGVEYTSVTTMQVTPGGTSGQLLGIDAIREFNVMTDAYGAEYGKKSGAQISIVTESGTNQLHGTLFEFLRNSDLDARNFFDYPNLNPATATERIPAFRRNQFGGGLGGPIQKDKTFIFGSYEGFRQRLGISDVALVPDNGARQGLLPNSQGVETPVTGLNTAMLPYVQNFWPAPNGPDLGGGIAYYYSNPTQSIREDFGTTRIDQNFSDKDTLSAVYTYDDGRNVLPSTDPLFVGINDLRDQVLSLQQEHILSPQTLNIFRVGFTRSQYWDTTPPAEPFPSDLSFVTGQIPGSISIGGVATSTGIHTITSAGAANPFERMARNLFTFNDDFQMIRGKHQISFGVWFQPLQQNEYPGSLQASGQASFTSLTTLLQGTTSSFTAVPNPTFVGFRMLAGAWYAQDAITLRPNLSLRLGLRQEMTNGWNEADNRLSNWTYQNGVFQTTPLVGEFLTQNNAIKLFGPRAGLAWDPFGKGKTAIRAGAGIYYDLLDTYSTYADAAPPYSGIDTYGENTAFLPLVPINPSTPVPVQCGSGVPQPCAIYSPQGSQPTMKTPTVDEWNFTVEQEITRNTSFRAAYVGSHADHITVQGDLNSIPPQICSNPAGCVSGGVNTTTGVVPEGTLYVPVGTRPNPYLSYSTIMLSEGVANYNALQLDMVHRFSGGLQLRANYTWSKNLDTASAFAPGGSANEAGQLMLPYDPQADYGPAADNITNQASISGNYELPIGHGKRWGNGFSGTADKLVSGWQMNWIVTLLSGFPFDPEVGTDQSGDGNTKAPDRPSWNPAFTGTLIEGTPTQWFNPDAFILPVSGTFGNVGRDVLTGPGLGTLDLSLFKTTQLTEKLRLEFRAEAFNITNRANFGTPNLGVFSSGQISSTAGVITSTATTSRQIQFGLKLIF